ncbi:chemotaxis-specific protein-glutamate methyltransferase CheB [Moorena producens JHB]|uniref:Protein-glutamate methylesterase/protein-glutamine glutaminase n=1 Tax=Moorena producens (strain JHB) TaxID=1454205 RepID=A0A1D9G3K8_MOOP1|nr:chemotaxis-specific protein-glutamate methyltransferase CheB [Moorena producens]AOY82222.1 chemotaxis-specific protein-glutamate methyltransferase CheB [Moorena producens JHB]
MTIRVLLVEDSPIALVALKRILNSSEQIEVVGEAGTGLEALNLIPKVQPDVICTDLHMPQMNGLELTSEVMALYPRPILVVSVSVQQEDTEQIFQLLDAGAVDILPKPSAGMTTDNHLLQQQLINKIKILSGVKVFTKNRKSILGTEKQGSSGKGELPEMDYSTNQNQIGGVSQTGNLAAFSSNYYSKPRVVVIGASTGGPQALNEIFTQLPSNFPLPVICVQHISLGFLEGFIDWLASSCPLSVQIAQPGDMPKPGRIYFPPEQQHLELDAMGRFICSDSEPLEGHRPSVTVTFKSVAKFYGKATVGILLTGMGRDGATGMQTIAEVGGLTIAQDEATSLVFGMPKEAIALGVVKQVLAIGAIAPRLRELCLINTSFFEN